MSRRPKGWKNPYYIETTVGGTTEAYNKQPEFSAFEEGADAILDGLKIGARKIGINDAKVILEDERGTFLLEIPKGQKGWLVFIQEEMKE